MIKTRQELRDYWNTYINTNNTGAITGAIQNVGGIDIIDSVALTADLSGQEFTQLGDTPASYVGSGGFSVSVKADESGLEFNNTNRGGVFEAHYNFNTDLTPTDPGPGNVKYDHADPQLVTTIYIAADDNTGASRSTAIGALRTGDAIGLVEGTGFNNYAVSGTITDNTSWFELPVIHLNSNIAYVDGAPLSVGIIYKSGTKFTQLDDTPADYTGSAGKAAVVNTAEDGLEFNDLTTTFSELADTPGSYAGHAGKSAVVKAAETALEFQTVDVADKAKERWCNGYSADTGLNVNGTLNWSTVTWDRFVQGSANIYSTTATGLKVAETGVYLFSWNSRNDQSERPVYVARNGTRITQWLSFAVGDPQNNSTFTVVQGMNAGEEFQIMRNGGASHPQSQPSFSCVKLSD